MGGTRAAMDMESMVVVIIMEGVDGRMADMIMVAMVEVTVGAMPEVLVPAMDSVVTMVDSNITVSGCSLQGILIQTRGT